MLNSPVTKIKERLNIEEVVSTYIKLEKTGANFKAKCPFHNEKTASFFISPERGSYYCFGCQAKGDIFTFVQEFEGLDFKGALKLLAERAGVPLQSYYKEEGRATLSEKEKLYKVMEEATKFFENNLKVNSEVSEYLVARGLKENTIRDFRIGFVKADWRELYVYLSAKKFSDSDMEKAGLIKKTEKGYYDRFRGRIMFPLFDSSGRVIAFSGRIFVDDGKSAKYLNSPETPIFSKSAVFYGLDKAKDSIRKNNFSIIVEGQMDLILSHQAGWKNTVATSGTALSDATMSKENVVSNLGLVRRLSPNVVLAFDGDKAGVSATKRAGKIALSLGMDVKVAMMPKGVDPADLISKSGAEAWREAIKNSKHLIEFILENILQNSNGDVRKVGRSIKEEVLPFVNSLSSFIEKSYFIKKISGASSVAVSALEEDLKKIEQELKYEKNEIEQIKESSTYVFRKDYILRRLLGIVLWQQGSTNKSINTEEVLKNLAEILNIEKEKLLDNTKDEKEDLIFEAEVFYEDVTRLQKETAELLSNLNEEYLKEQLSVKMQELHLSEENKDTTKTAEILKECQIISNKIEDLKNSRAK